MLFFPPFPTISRYFPRFPGPPTPLGKGPRAVRSLLSCALRSGMGRLCGAAWRGMGGRRPPRRQLGLLGFHQPRDTQHGVSLSLRRLQGEQPQARPTGFSRITNHETRITAFMLFSLLSCKLWSGMARLWRGMGAILSPSRCPRTGRSEIPVMCTKSRFPQENARSAEFAAAPFALGAQPAEVDAKGRTAHASTAKTTLIRVDSCPFVVNEPMLRKGNVLYCIDRLFDKRAPAGSRGFRGECRAGWSVRASSSERKSHVPR